MAGRTARLAGTFVVGAAAWAASAPLHAQDANGGVLAACTARSPLIDDLHACLDDYLATMDENLADLDRYIERSLDAEARTAFDASRRAFALYRRDNCLWYLAFSTPRSEAELIAKDCLATMSIRRLTELQRLLAANDGAGAVLDGYYVYGADRNTFRPCGSGTRYWVEGEATVVGGLQQRYLETATDELQVLYATLRGEREDGVQTVDGHDGVVRVNAVAELRVPRESDCPLPDGAGLAAADALAPPIALSPVAPVDDEVDVDLADEGTADQEEPEQQLLAYFGAWLADCTERPGVRVCALSTALVEDGNGGGEAPGEGGPEVRLTRGTAESTVVELVFPDREIDSPARLRWSVDGYVLGDILGSSIRVDERATRQIVDDRAFVEEELLPLMIEGGELVVDVLASVDDESGERSRATLVGLTRALAFADGFVRDGNGL